MTPKFYTKAAIGWLTVIFTPFFGSILLCYNLREVGKKRPIPLLIITGLLWSGIFQKLLSAFIYNELLKLIVSNIIGSLVLIFLWNRFFAIYPTYEKKKIWKPVLIMVTIGVALILLLKMANGK